jgi:uncharacterized protein
MRKIGILSDTHGFLHPKVFDFFSSCDEIFHAGDIGDISVIRDLENFKPLTAVYGNIDGHEIRKKFQDRIITTVENVKIFMTHIGGYPGRYPKPVTEIFGKEHPDLFICGHSHILKILYDRKYQLLNINPGAAGKFGFHNSMTFVRLIISGKEMKDLEILDLPRNSQKPGDEKS